MSKYEEYRYAAFKTTMGSLTSRAAQGFTGGNFSADGTMVVGDLGSKTNAVVSVAHTPDKPAYVVEEMPDWPYLSWLEANTLVHYSEYAEHGG